MEGGDEQYVPMRVGRLVVSPTAHQQYVQLVEAEGSRSFPIVIGPHEAEELRRVLLGVETPRPMTHNLALEGIKSLGGEVAGVRIVDLRDNTFHARLVLRGADGTEHAVDARPSDALALGLRQGCSVEVAESVLQEVRTDDAGPDPLPPSAPDVF